MKPLDQVKPLSAGEQKIAEYAKRINAGESKDAVLQGLPKSFVAAVEAQLTGQAEKPRQETAAATIPPQYKGLSSEQLDLIWEIPQYADPEKTRELREQKAKALATLRAREVEELGKKQKQETAQKRAEEIKAQVVAKMQPSGTPRAASEGTQTAEQIYPPGKMIGWLRMLMLNGVGTLYVYLNKIPDPKQRLEASEKHKALTDACNRSEKEGLTPEVLLGAVKAYKEWKEVVIRNGGEAQLKKLGSYEPVEKLLQPWL